MLFLFLTTIGVSLVLQQKIRQEYEGVDDPKRQLAQLEEYFTVESVQLDGELADLLAQHSALVARRGHVSAVSEDLYEEAMAELERDLSRDPLAEAFDDLEKGHDEKKKKGL